MSENKKDQKSKSPHSWTNLDDPNNDPMNFYYPVFPVFKGPDKNGGGCEGCTGDTNSNDAVSSDNTTTGCTIGDSTVVPPADSTVVPPADSTVVPPADSTVVPPADSTVVPPADSTVVPPADSTVVPPADSVKSCW